jgi:hypothetical protein
MNYVFNQPKVVTFDRLLVEGVVCLKKCEDAIVIMQIFYGYYLDKSEYSAIKEELGCARGAMRFVPLESLSLLQKGFTVALYDPQSKASRVRHLTERQLLKYLKSKVGEWKDTQFHGLGGSAVGLGASMGNYGAVSGGGTTLQNTQSHQGPPTTLQSASYAALQPREPSAVLIHGSALDAPSPTYSPRSKGSELASPTQSHSQAQLAASIVGGGMLIQPTVLQKKGRPDLDDEQDEEEDRKHPLRRIILQNKSELDMLLKGIHYRKLSNILFSEFKEIIRLYRIQGHLIHFNIHFIHECSPESIAEESLNESLAKQSKIKRKMMIRSAEASIASHGKPQLKLITNSPKKVNKDAAKTLCGVSPAKGSISACSPHASYGKTPQNAFALPSVALGLPQSRSFHQDTIASEAKDGDLDQPSRDFHSSILSPSADLHDGNQSTVTFSTSLVSAIEPVDGQHSSSFAQPSMLSSLEMNANINSIPATSISSFKSHLHQNSKEIIVFSKIKFQRGSACSYTFSRNEQDRELIKCFLEDTKNGMDDSWWDY